MKVKRPDERESSSSSGVHDDAHKQTNYFGSKLSTSFPSNAHTSSHSPPTTSGAFIFCSMFCSVLTSKTGQSKRPSRGRTASLCWSATEWSYSGSLTQNWLGAREGQTNPLKIWWNLMFPFPKMLFQAANHLSNPLYPPSTYVCTHMWVALIERETRWQVQRHHHHHQNDDTLSTPTDRYAVMWLRKPYLSRCCRCCAWSTLNSWTPQKDITACRSGLNTAVLSCCVDGLWSSHQTNWASEWLIWKRFVNNV